LALLLQKVIGSHQSLGNLVKDKIFYGVLTGSTDVFVIDATKRKQLIAEHPSSAEIIKLTLRGQDARPWYQIDGHQYLICAQHGIDIKRYPAILRYLESHKDLLEPKPADWNDKKDGTWQGRSAGTYKWYEWISPVAYFEEFSKPKIVWSDISKLPRFSWDADGKFYTNTVYSVGNASLPLLALMQSRVHWYFIAQLATPLRLRAGLWQYRLFKQFIERLPIPDLSVEQESSLATIAEEITGLAQSRYTLHEDFRHVLRSEFGGGEISTRVALYRWWEFSDEKVLSDEINKQFKREIPFGKRLKWREFLTDQKAEHIRLTNQIIGLETRMNDIVYDAFDLTPEERALIEKATKYPYGAV